MHCSRASGHAAAVLLLLQPMLPVVLLVLMLVLLVTALVVQSLARPPSVRNSPHRMLYVQHSHGSEEDLHGVRTGQIPHRGHE